MLAEAGPGYLENSQLSDRMLNAPRLRPIWREWPPTLYGLARVKGNQTY